MAHTDIIEGGFADPVYEAQSVFRDLMNAMARPGIIQSLQPAVMPPTPLTPVAAAVALTLCDHDTPLWLDPTLAGERAVGQWLGFHTGAPLAMKPAEARFALVANPAELIDLQTFAQGSQDYPDRSTTLILQLQALDGGAPLRLEGPGIENVTRLAPQPLPANFIDRWGANNMRFPRGVDLILTAPGLLACLPRTTKITGEKA